MAWTHTVRRSTQITVPHSMKSVFTFSCNGTSGTPRRDTKNSSSRNSAVNVNEIGYSVDVSIL
jgi:hypothetical protein